MGGILTFREGTAEIKVNAIYAVGLNVLRQILRTAIYKPHILNYGFLYFLTGGDYNISVLFHRNKINIGVAAGKFQSKAALASAYFNHIGGG